VTTQPHDYDLAFSFAGEHRQYVEQTRLACERLGLTVFYDRDLNNEWWGKNFIREQRKVYGQRVRYFVPFISDEYFRKPIPADEFETAIWAYVQRQGEYILPVIIGSPEIPEDRLPPHIHYLKADHYTPEELAHEMYIKVRGAKNSNQQPREISAVVSEAMSLPLPRVTPADFSKYQELRSVIEFIGDNFERQTPRLRDVGFICTVDRAPEKVSVRIERSGETVYSLDARKASMGDATIELALNQWRSYSNAYNATARPYFDRDAACPKLKIIDFSLLGLTGQVDLNMTKAELFEAIWTRMIWQLESLR
jgi:hypothetical protein